MMDGLEGIVYDTVSHPAAFSKLNPGNLDKYDAILLYDMPQEISGRDRENFLDMFERGKGVVVLHHATGSYDDWYEFVKIAGGHFNLSDKPGRNVTSSGFTMDVTMKVRVLDTEHPVVKGIGDFEITDETYGNMELLPGIHPLLGTDEATSCHYLCWTNRYGNSRIVTILLGHDDRAWSNPDFSRLLRQALKWVERP